MKKLVMRLKMWLAVLVSLVAFTACGGGNGGTGGTVVTQLPELKSFGWYFENLAPDYSTSGTTCSLRVNFYYGSGMQQGDFDSFIVTAPTGTRWTVPAANMQFLTSSSGASYATIRLRYSLNPQTFPLAGTWTAEIKAKNGTTSSLTKTFHEPGNSSAATHQFVYTKEDWTPSANQSQYVAALARFPSQGYTLTYSATNGSITSTGFAATRVNYQWGEPHAYNMFCWLYDSNKNYLGYTTTVYSTVDHTTTNLIANTGELQITPAFVTPATTTPVNLSTVKYVRFVVTDGGQYAPVSYASYDYRSISALVGVN